MNEAVCGKFTHNFAAAACIHADYTNGILEVANPAKEMYGVNHLMRLSQARSRSRRPEPYRLMFSNYLTREWHSITLVIDKAQKDLVSVSIVTNLDSRSDEVHVSVQLAEFPEGPVMFQARPMNGLSKQLTVVVKNRNYQKL